MDQDAHGLHTHIPEKCNSTGQAPPTWSHEAKRPEVESIHCHSTLQPRSSQGSRASTPCSTFPFTPEPTLHPNQPTNHLKQLRHPPIPVLPYPPIYNSSFLTIQAVNPNHLFTSLTNSSRVTAEIATAAATKENRPTIKDKAPSGRDTLDEAADEDAGDQPIKEKTSMDTPSHKDPIQPFKDNPTTHHMVTNSKLTDTRYKDQASTDRLHKDSDLKISDLRSITHQPPTQTLDLPTKHQPPTPTPEQPSDQSDSHPMDQLTDHPETSRMLDYTRITDGR